MATVEGTCDIFIAHPSRDTDLAWEVASACREAGFRAITESVLLSGDDPGDALREAIAESHAILAILSPAGLTSSMAIEIGAARAWDKPIFAIVTDPALVRPPAALAGVRLFTVGRLPDVIRAVRSTIEPLTDAERDLLAELYVEMGMTVDELQRDPASLEIFAISFETKSGRFLLGERLLSEILRRRKVGRWPKLSRPPGRRREGKIDRHKKVDEIL